MALGRSRSSRIIQRVSLATASALVVGFLVGPTALAAGASVFPNGGAISIPSQGKASPYPSTISVSGLAGTIADVNVTLTHITHTFPDDIDVLLVGPAGQKVVLMADTGGGNDISNVNLTFDDSAASLPDSSQIASGTYKPTIGTTAGAVGDTAGFDGTSPAPSGPYASALSAFNGTVPNGTWNLYVYDDGSGDSGSISGGWSLDITVNPPPTISSFSPASGRVGDLVVIIGTNLTGATAVKFNGTSATSFTVNSSTQITATVPAGATAGTLTVTTPSGTGTSPTRFVVKHVRTITLSLGKRARGSVTVADGFVACASGVPVKVQHFDNGKWKVVASVLTNSGGSYTAGGVRDPGRYRSVALAHRLGTGDKCVKDVSPVAKR